MFSLAEQWRIEDRKRRAPDLVEHWNERSATYANHSHSGYAESFIKKMDLAQVKLILDMGCGTGSLAIPLAQRGYGVIAADFSSGMLDQLRQYAQEKNIHLIEWKSGDDLRSLRCLEGGFIAVVLLKWDDDWASFGLMQDSVDVAISSRSLITHDMEDSLKKLSRVASKRVYVTVGTGISPRVNPDVAKAMGIHLNKHNDALFVFGIAHELGYEPEVSYIHSPRKKLYNSRNEAYHSLLDTMNYVSDKDLQVDPHIAAQRLSDWLLVHLIPAEEKGKWCLDKPYLVPWAFLSWNV